MILEALVKQATQGDEKALQEIIGTIQDSIFYLALRMLYHPQDAEDATQEILIKVITNLSQFQHRSSFNTWVYRIACNYLLSSKKIKDKDMGLNFDLYQQDLESDLQAPDELQQATEYPLLVNEVRISCSIAMLLCLTADQRIAYILGDIFEMDQVEASTAMEISKDNFRQLLSRARKKVIDFTQKSCGLVSDTASCRCSHKLKGAIKRQRIKPKAIFYANQEQLDYEQLQQEIRKTQDDLKTLKLQRAISPYACPKDFTHLLNNLLQH